jgi:hypothetical protein
MKTNVDAGTSPVPENDADAQLCMKERKKPNGRKAMWIHKSAGK